MSRLAAFLADGTEVPLSGEVLRRVVAVAREWVRRNPWSPLPGPQSMAFESLADIVGYGGAAGGGKTDLACGKAITRHRKAMVLRRVGTELQGILDRLEELIGNSDGKNGQLKVWKRRRHDGVPQQIEWASLPNAGDERGFQGRPHDLLIFDEAANFLESQVRFLMGWVRTTIKGQRCQVLMCFNPPTSAEGQWIIAFFAPWLDKRHPNPAAPGELRWFATIKGKDYEVPDAQPFVLAADGVTRIYDFDPKAYRGTERTKVIKPKSRTFIPSNVTDNPFLMGTDYMSMLQALPEPLRSQMLNGDFEAGMRDDVWQVIPSEWVDLAMARWKPHDKLPVQDSLGVDVARGGDDETVIAARYGRWYAPLKVYEGKQTPDGHTTATYVLMEQRDRAPIHIDVIGVGSSPHDRLMERGVQSLGINVAIRSNGTDKTGHLRFLNLRAELWWRLRESLDPANNDPIALPPDTKLKQDLTAPKWKLQGAVITVESREDIVKRIGRSVDRASAVILAQIETPRATALRGAHVGAANGDYDPYAAIRG